MASDVLVSRGASSSFSHDTPVPIVGISGLSSEERESSKVTQREMWEGGVPVVFNLAPAEVVLPRASYLPLVTGDVRSHFLPSAPAREDEMWFEYAGIPLKWHIPIGVLFDLFVGAGLGSHPLSISSSSATIVGTVSASNNGSSSTDRSLLHMITPKLPWELTVHFQGFPAKDLLRCRNTENVRTFYINAFKEATFLRYGSVQPVVSLSKLDQSTLWDAVVNTKFDNFRRVRDIVELNGDRDYGTLRLPVRLFLQGFDGGPGCGGPVVSISSEFNQKCVQLPLPPVAPNGTPHTVKSALQFMVPGLFSESTGTSGVEDDDIGEIGDVEVDDDDSSSRPGLSLSSAAATAESKTEEESEGSTAVPGSRRASVTGGIVNGKKVGRGWEVLVQGTVPPLSAPLLWLYNNMSHPDMFLYISVCKL